MKSSKIWKIIWISGIYAILLVILYLVVLYKVEWESKDLNTYLYFYDCNHHLCTSTTNQENYYSKIICEDNNCPYIDTIIDNNLILKKDNTSWIYNYHTNEIINNKYQNYRYIGNNLYVVNDLNNQYGVINLNGDLIVDLKYNYIDDYKEGIISYIDNNLYGIISTDNKYNITPKFDDIVLINDKIFAGKLDNIYQLHSYDNIENDNSNKYNYVYSYDNIILVANNNKIDILDSNLKSTLIMKINTFYEYTREEERASLDIYNDGTYLYFKVFTSETEYTTYKYSIKNKKLITD